MEDRLDQSARLRNQAEEILRQKPTYSRESIEALSSDAILQEFQELHLHQIELEMQNVELRRSQKELAIEREHAEEILRVLNVNLELKFNQQTQELQESQKQYMHAEKLSLIGKLSASIAHEFNNPLQGILSILQGLNKRAILEEEDKELLLAAIDEGDRIKNLIRSLQDFNRPSSGRTTVMDVHSSIDLILLLNKSDFNGRRISVVRNYTENLPQILAVSDQIKQVILNLLTNAADACEKCSNCVITISTRQENDKVAVAIKDTGSGIKPENIEFIFHPFFSTKSEVKGIGLGLSVSHTIVKKHHGEILVESQLGEGTTFTVLLPINEARR